MWDSVKEIIFIPVKEESLQPLKEDYIPDISLDNNSINYATILYCELEVLDHSNICGKIVLILEKNHTATYQVIENKIIAVFLNSADRALESAIGIAKLTSIDTNCLHIFLSTHVNFDFNELENRFSGLSHACSTAEELGIIIGSSESTMAELINPTHYKYRFAGRFPLDCLNKSTPLFDFFDGDDRHTQEMKSGSKEAFEESLINYYMNRYEAALAGFHSALKIYPEDKVAKKIVMKLEKIIY